MDKEIKLALERGEILPLMEAFYTIQGEGYYAGKAAYFLRIGGCDVGCQWCDVKESWDFAKHSLTSVEDILQGIHEYSADTVVITGGEPLLWNLTILTNSLISKGYKVHLETSGAYPLTGSFDWICLSPKKMKPALDEIKPFANEFKVIINNKRDLLWADMQTKGLKSECKLYLQPEWSKKDIIIPMIIDFIQENRYWTISLQTHKYMHIP